MDRRGSEARDRATRIRRREPSRLGSTTCFVASLDEVRAALANGSAQVVDARPGERFRGEAPEPRAGLKSGHMPGSLNLPFSEVVEHGRLKPPRGAEGDLRRAQGRPRQADHHHLRLGRQRGDPGAGGGGSRRPDRGPVRRLVGGMGRARRLPGGDGPRLKALLGDEKVSGREIKVFKALPQVSRATVRRPRKADKGFAERGVCVRRPGPRWRGAGARAVLAPERRLFKGLRPASVPRAPPQIPPWRSRSIPLAGLPTARVSPASMSRRTDRDRQELARWGTEPSFCFKEYCAPIFSVVKKMSIGVRASLSAGAVGVRETFA